MHHKTRFRWHRPCAAGLLGLLTTGAPAGGLPVVELPAIEVDGEAVLADAARSSTEGFVTDDQLAERPVSRSGELLEFVPGLIVTQHSGEGKANQYFLRGFNLDHGTDFYTEVDGVPVNQRSHGHGQGYADINFIIPELIGTLDYRKGPYYAEVGDFAAAGSANLRYVDALPAPLATLTAGEYGYRSALLAASPAVGAGRLLLAGEATHYDGAYALQQNARIGKALLRYGQGDGDDGFMLGFQGYGIDYRAPDQIPLRAVQDGRIDRFGYIDPSDGGNVRRYSLNAEIRRRTDSGRWSADAYALRYRMQLYSDFTYSLSDPDDTDAQPDDQFEQFDDRRVYGARVRRLWTAGTRLPAEIETGLQARYDDIAPVGLYLTQARMRSATVREDRVHEGSLGAWIVARQRWQPWLRSELGLRADAYTFEVDSDRAANSGQARDHLLTPKAALVLGPWQQTSLFLNYGQGFHSNDARGTTIRQDPADPSGATPADRVTPLVRIRGAEAGITSARLADTTFSATVWRLESDSELVYIGDAGTSEAGPPSTRRGVELAAYWAPRRWLVVDADYARSHGRLDVPDGEGDRIPNSVESVLSLGLTLPATAPELRGWSAGLRLRHLGPAALVEDNSVRSQTTTVVNLQTGYRYRERYRIALAVLNVFDSRDNDITYFYASRLPGEPADGVADRHFHPVEPRALRLTLAATLR